jgi:predicted esterase
VKEYHVEVNRSARYVTLGEQREPPREIWFALHGYRQLASRFARPFAAIAGGGRLVVAPEGLSRFYVDDSGGRHGPEHRVGASWMTHEDRLREIDDYRRYLNRVREEAFRTPGGPDARVVVLGFSQGVATAARWVAGEGVRADDLVLWGGLLSREVEEVDMRERIAGVRVHLVAGEKDPHLSPSEVREEEARLAGWGIACRVMTYPGGHDIEESALKELARLLAASSGPPADVSTA